MKKEAPLKCKGLRKKTSIEKRGIPKTQGVKKKKPPTRKEVPLNTRGQKDHWQKSVTHQNVTHLVQHHAEKANRTVRLPQASPVPPRQSKARVTLFTLMTAKHRQYHSIINLETKSHEGDASKQNRTKAIPVNEITRR
jgi:hypothetical protein